MDVNFPQIENKILKFWVENKIFEKFQKKNQGKKRWSFLDGPITANNPMGVHHAWGRTYKDLFQRYKVMRGFDQRFQNGFDCQGLWVEVEVEKELGFKTKKDIEIYGIEKFVQACKERVKKYSKIQTEQSIRLGQWMDWGDYENGLGNSYYTMSNENNYSIWAFLKKCYEKGLLYKGRDVVPWCIRCGTAISQHEILTEEYKELTHKSIFFKLPIIDRNKTYLLVWTTTPWTLPANVAVAVNPELIYAEIKDKNNDIFICLKSKAELIESREIIKELSGKELEGLEYQGLFDELPEVQKEMSGQKHRVVLWEDVSEEEGTGIVHIAPGCGEEDFQLGETEKLATVNPLDDESRYREGFDFLTGKLATEVADLIFDNLTNKNFVYKIEDYTHRYPTCWRCKSELIFRLVDEWYISMEKLRGPLMEVTKKINWIPSFGKERELDWLKNMHDWLISKKRYWGLALPIFECNKCGNFEVVGSKAELKEKAVEGWDKFEGNSPHRPWVDEVKIKCSKCGEIISRIKDVGNPWLDAGIVSFSTLIDPETKKVSYFDNKKYWKNWFPFELICESFPGQFKNWFYSLIVMSTVFENHFPSKTIFGYASVHDENDEEMHKSKGNAIWFDDAVEKIGADPMRWMYARQNPFDNLRFGYNNAAEITRKLLTLYNSFTFLTTYVDKRDLPDENFKLESKNVLDKWIISKFNSLVINVAEDLDKYDAMSATLAIEKFFIDDLSLWYIKQSRKRFHDDCIERKEAIHTFYYILLNLTKLIAPIIPFFAEEMYAQLKPVGSPESVHLCDWPKVDNGKIDKKLEEKMEKLQEIFALGLAKRAEAGIKVRQPLASLSTNIELVSDEDLCDILKEGINVKEIIFDKNLKEKIVLDIKLTPELEKEGRKRDFIRNVRDLRKTAGLTPKDFMIVTGSVINIIPSLDDARLKEEIGAMSIEIKTIKEMKAEDYFTKEVNYDGGKGYLGIKKI